MKLKKNMHAEEGELKKRDRKTSWKIKKLETEIGKQNKLWCRDKKVVWLNKWKELARKENCDAKKMPWIGNNSADKKKREEKERERRRDGKGNCKRECNAVKGKWKGVVAIYSIKREEP